MAGISIRVIPQDDGVRQLFGTLRRRCNNMQPAMKIVGQIVRTSSVKNFESGGRPTAWPLSRRAMKEGGQTLVKSGRLKNSINVRATTVAVEIGTNLIYARIHQLGGEIRHPARERVLHFRHNELSGEVFPRFVKKRQATFDMHVAGKSYRITMPQRQFLLIQDEDWREIRRALEEFLLNGI